MQKYLQRKQEKAAEKKAAIQAMQEKIAQLEQESQQPSEGRRQKMEDLKVQFRALQNPSTLTVEDLAAVGIKCNDAAELKYISEALADAEPHPKTIEALQAYIAVRFDPYRKERRDSSHRMSLICGF